MKTDLKYIFSLIIKFYLIIDLNKQNYQVNSQKNLFLKNFTFNYTSNKSLPLRHDVLNIRKQNYNMSYIPFLKIKKIKGKSTSNSIIDKSTSNIIDKSTSNIIDKSISDVIVTLSRKFFDSHQVFLVVEKKIFQDQIYKEVLSKHPVVIMMDSELSKEHEKIFVSSGKFFN